MSQENCVFCLILQGKIPAKKLYEDEHTLCFMDINPAAPGHCLVVPKHHCVMFSELPEAYASAVGIATARAAQLLERAGVRDYNILNNNGELSGQVVKHVHVHLIPKTADSEGLVGHFGECSCSVDAEYAKLLRFK